MKFGVMLYQWKQHLFFWESLGNMIEKIYMMDLRTKNSFNFHEHKIILKPLSPKEVHKDQIKMKKREKM